MATAYQKDGERRLRTSMQTTSADHMQKVPLNEGGLEQNRQHSKSDRRAELSCFLALLDAAHSRYIPTLLKGKSCR